LQRLYILYSQANKSVPATCLRYWTLTRGLTAHWVLLQIRLEPWMGNLSEGLTIHERASFLSLLVFLTLPVTHPPPTENALGKFPKCIWRWNSHSAFLHFALLGVVFCLDFSPFFFLLLFPLPGVFPLLICLFYPTLRDAKEILFCRSRSWLVLCIQGDHSPSLLPFPPSPIEGNFHILLTSHP